MQSCTCYQPTASLDFPACAVGNGQASEMLRALAAPVALNVLQGGPQCQSIAVGKIMGLGVKFLQSERLSHFYLQGWGQFPHPSGTRSRLALEPG